MFNTQTDISIENGFAEAQKIIRKRAKTFSFASLFLPKDTRNAVAALYVICRNSDDAVDSAVDSQRTENIARIRGQVESAYADARMLDDSVLLAFRETALHYKIPKQYFDELLEGMSMDITKNRYGNFQELYEYSYRVAGVIGLMVLKLLNCENEQAKKHAVELGIALQLTNILRDIKEDWQRGRVYLPLDEMRQFQVTEEDIRQERLSDNFKALLQSQISRARSYYASAAIGIKFVSGVRSRFVIHAMLAMYSAILNAIENFDYTIFSQRARVNTLGKIRVVLGVLGKGEYW